jgi:hypothetical protein
VLGVSPPAVVVVSRSSNDNRSGESPWIQLMASAAPTATTITATAAITHVRGWRRKEGELDMVAIFPGLSDRWPSTS